MKVVILWSIANSQTGWAGISTALSTQIKTRRLCCNLPVRSHLRWSLRWGRPRSPRQVWGERSGWRGEGSDAPDTSSFGSAPGSFSPSSKAGSSGSALTCDGL